MAEWSILAAIGAGTLIVFNPIVIYLATVSMMWHGLDMLRLRGEARRAKLHKLAWSAAALGVCLACLPLFFLFIGGASMNVATALGFLVAVLTMWTHLTVYMACFGAVVVAVDAGWRLCSRVRRWSWTPTRMLLQAVAFSVFGAVALMAVLHLTAGDYAVDYMMFSLTQAR